MRSVFLWFFLALLPVAAWPADRLATVTIVDGELFVMRDASRYAMAEGTRLQADDILETSPASRLVRIEFTAGPIVDIGPATRLWLAPRFGERGDKRAARVYMLEGWAKLTAPKQGVDLFASPWLDITSIAQDVVVAISPEATRVFAETGEVQLVERQGGKSVGKPGGMVKLRPGEFYTRGSDPKSSVTPRPSAEFVASVPRPFLDTLPSRAAQFDAKDVAPKLLGAMSYAEAQPWIDGEASVRPAFLARWKRLAQNPEFRKALLANERAHPEWDRVLHPRKYLPP
ncbi:hypothetical protein BH11PSE9_BH11PSE9_31630 [soil metagenome]